MSNKKVVLLVLGIFGGVTLIIALFAGTIVGFVFHSLNSSDAAQTARAFLRGNKRLKREIGEVRDFGWFTTGEIKAQSSAGDAELHLKTIGENRTVNATVVLASRGGSREWRVTDAYYDDAGERIDLTNNFADEGDPRAVENSGEGGDAQPEAGGDADNSGDANGQESFDEESFSANVLRSSLPVLVVLAPQANPDSLELDKTLDGLAEQYAERVDIARYDLGAQPALFRRFDVKAVPTLIVFKGGAERERLAGKVSAGELSRLLDKYLQP